MGGTVGDPYCAFDMLFALELSVHGKGLTLPDEIKFSRHVDHCAVQKHICFSKEDD